LVAKVLTTLIGLPCQMMLQVIPPRWLVGASDFLPVPSGLISVASNYDYKAVSTLVDPYTLITGEDTATALSSPDLFALDSDLVDTFKFASTLTKDHFDIWEFGTATLVFISDSELTTILVEPTLDWTDWFDWIPLPRLTPTESYFHTLVTITFRPLLSSI